jgi:catechol 2,3-dioxygenase-like lactoylglutathione lyase family enzyme
MSRVQLALNVNDVDEAIAFYSKLFGTEPAKVRPGYANFVIAAPPLKLVLLENPGRGGSLNHLGIEVPDTDALGAEQARLAGTGLAAVDERDTTCCYAKQDKFWVQGAPDGASWEVYTVLADSQTFYDEDQDGPGCCGGASEADASESAEASARQDCAQCPGGEGEAGGAGRDCQDHWPEQDRNGEHDCDEHDAVERGDAHACRRNDRLPAPPTPPARGHRSHRWDGPRLRRHAHRVLCRQRPSPAAVGPAWRPRPPERVFQGRGRPAGKDSRADMRSSAAGTSQ